MKHRFAVNSLILLSITLLPTSLAWAVPINIPQERDVEVLDFNDLDKGPGDYCTYCFGIPEDPYRQFNLIQTGGVNLTLENMLRPRIPEDAPESAIALVIGDSSGGNALEITEGLLNPELQEETDYISFDFVEFGLSSQLVINDSLVETHALSGLHGRVIDGVIIEVLKLDAGNPFTRLILRGDLDIFRFGGEHLLVDNFAHGRAEVPEPSTLFLLGAALAGGLRCRSKNKVA